LHFQFRQAHYRGSAGETHKSSEHLSETALNNRIIKLAKIYEQLLVCYYYKQITKYTEQWRIKRSWFLFCLNKARFIHLLVTLFER
jgi:hypothetical protein